MTNLPSLLSRTVLVLATCAGAAGAQRARLGVDLGTSSVRYADSIQVAALTVTPAFDLAGRAAFLSGSGTLSQSSGAQTFSGTAFGGIAPQLSSRYSIELGGAFGGSSHSDGSRTGQMLGSGRLYVSGGGLGAWGGAGLGRTWDGTKWRGLVQATLGAWLGRPAGSVVVNVSPTSVDDSIRYTDGILTLQRPGDRVALSASLGARFGDPLPSLVTDRLWGSVSGTLWVQPFAGIVASAGTYPVDFTQGYPGGRYVSLALRLQRERARTLPEVRLAGAPASNVRAFEAQRAGSSVRIRVHAPGARTVELAGSLTQWAAVQLVSEGNGWWSTSRTATPGHHEITVRVNGGAWEVPPGLPVLRDEFGGVAGLLVVR
jgi:hypothetical protein